MTYLYNQKKGILFSHLIDIALLIESFENKRKEKPGCSWVKVSHTLASLPSLDAAPSYCRYRL